MAELGIRGVFILHWPRSGLLASNARRRAHIIHTWGIRRVTCLENAVCNAMRARYPSHSQEWAPTKFASG